MCTVLTMPSDSALSSLHGVMRVATGLIRQLSVSAMRDIVLLLKMKNRFVKVCLKFHVPTS